MRTSAPLLAYRLTGILCGLCLCFFLFSIYKPISSSNFPTPVSDGEKYFRLAAEGPKGVVAPFSGRIFHPLLARLTSRVFNIRMEEAFFIVSALFLVLWVCCVFLLLDASSFIHSFAYSLVFAYPFVGLIARQFYYPEVAHAALLSAFLVFLKLKRERVGLILLLLLLLTRETTMLLVAVLLAQIILFHRWKYAFGVAMVTGLGLTIVYMATRQGAPNPEHLPGFVYLALKVPFNFLRNLLGVELVTDAIWYCQPVISWRVPDILQIGNIRTIGLCSWNPTRALNTLGALLTVFGLWPTVLLWAARTRRLPQAQWMKTAAAYGVLAYFVGTSVGADVSRLISQGWPLILVAMASIAQSVDRKGGLLTMLSVFCLTISWLPKLVRSVLVHFLHIELAILSSATIVLLSLAVHVYLYKFLIIRYPGEFKS